MKGQVVVNITHLWFEVLKHPVFLRLRTVVHLVNPVLQKRLLDDMRCIQ